jgi:hypothetical protein
MAMIKFKLSKLIPHFTRSFPAFSQLNSSMVKLRLGFKDSHKPNVEKKATATAKQVIA